MPNAVCMGLQSVGWVGAVPHPRGPALLALLWVNEGSRSCYCDSQARYPPVQAAVSEVLWSGYVHAGGWFSGASVWHVPVQ